MVRRFTGSLKTYLGLRVARRHTARPVSRMLARRPLQAGYSGDSPALVWRGVRRQVAQSAPALSYEMLERLRERLGDSSPGDAEPGPPPPVAWAARADDRFPAGPSSQRVDQPREARPASRTPLKRTAVELQAAPGPRPAESPEPVAPVAQPSGPLQPDAGREPSLPGFALADQPASSEPIMGAPASVQTMPVNGTPSDSDEGVASVLPDSASYWPSLTKVAAGEPATESAAQPVLSVSPGQSPIQMTANNLAADKPSAEMADHSKPPAPALPLDSQPSFVQETADAEAVVRPEVPLAVGSLVRWSGATRPFSSTEGQPTSDTRVGAAGRTLPATEPPEPSAFAPAPDGTLASPTMPAENVERPGPAMGKRETPLVPESPSPAGSRLSTPPAGSPVQTARLAPGPARAHIGADLPMPGRAPLEARDASVAVPSAADAATPILAPPAPAALARKSVTRRAYAEPIGSGVRRLASHTPFAGVVRPRPEEPALTDQPPAGPGPTPADEARRAETSDSSPAGMPGSPARPVPTSPVIQAAPAARPRPGGTEYPAAPALIERPAVGAFEPFDVQRQAEPAPFEPPPALQREEEPAAPASPAPQGKPDVAPAAPAADLDSMARQVYQILQRRLRVEHERARGWSG